MDSEHLTCEDITNAVFVLCSCHVPLERKAYSLSLHVAFMPVAIIHGKGKTVSQPPKQEPKTYFLIKTVLWIGLIYYYGFPKKLFYS